MTLRSRLTALISLVALSATVTACAVADPDTSQAVLHYSGGPFSSQTFQNCITPGTRRVDGSGDFHYYYPNGRRTFDFTGGPSSESGAIKVSTKNANGTATEVFVRGVVTFSLNTDCSPWTDPDGRKWDGGVFQAFHDNIGRQHKAYASDGGEQQPDSWVDIVRLYVGGPTEKALDNVGPNYDWQRLSVDSLQRNGLQDDAFSKLPELSAKAAGGPYFVIHSLQLVSVDAPDQLKAAQDQVQTAQIAQQATKIDEETAANFPGGIGAYTDYLLKKAMFKALNEGRGIPIPAGSSVIVQQR